MKVFLTGGTGFLGEYLILELIGQGHEVWSLYRTEPRREETAEFLAAQKGFDPERLTWLKGDVLELDSLWEGWLERHPGLAEADSILHSAASLRFNENSKGEPKRTNVGSARVLRQLAERRGLQVHLVSTAFVCGRIEDESVRETAHPRGDFVSAYEESKWEAEQILKGRATMLRPGVIVGHSETGRSKSFTGWYIMVKGCHMMSRAAEFMDGVDRRDLGLQVPADPMGTLNMVPVDYVAGALVRIVQDPENHNKIFHLTHPDPPTHQWSTEVICRYFDLGGIELIGPDSPLMEPETDFQRLIWRQTRIMHRYFANNPLFDRTEIDRALPGLKPPPMDEPLIRKLIDYAVSVDWGD